MKEAARLTGPYFLSFVQDHFMGRQTGSADGSAFSPDYTRYPKLTSDFGMGKTQDGRRSSEVGHWRAKYTLTHRLDFPL